MSAAPRARRWRRALALASALGFAALIGRAWLGRKAADLEHDAALAWSGVAPPRAPAAEADASALALEAGARSLGLELAPRGSPRADPPRPAPVLESVHAALLATALEGRVLADAAPAVATWLRDASPDVESLARGVVARPAPRWEAPRGLAVTRAPPPGERADRLVAEAGRLEGRATEGRELGEDDRHLVRPGVPRLSSIVLLLEILMLDALQRGRADDLAGAARDLEAAERVMEGVLRDPDVLGVGVAVHALRLHAAVLRQLPIERWPRGLLDAPLRDLAVEVLAREAQRLDRAPRHDANAAAHIAGWALQPAERAMLASTRTGLAAARARALADPCSSRVVAGETAPWWDRTQLAYLRDISDLPHRAARADLDRELTRRVIDVRAGRPVAAGSCPGWRFEQLADGRVRFTGSPPPLARALPFELPLEAMP